MGIIDDWDAAADRWLKNVAYDARKDLDEMVRMFRPEAKPPLVVRMKSRCYDERLSHAHGLQRYASDIRVFKHANYAVCRTDQIRLPNVIGCWRARPVSIPEPGNGRPGYRIGRGIRSLERPYHLEQVGVDKAHAVTRGSGQNVAIIDTGIDDSHGEIAGKMVDGYNAIDDSASPFDGNGHGTHCAGLVAGTNVGIAPASSLYIAKALDDDGAGTEATIGLGIDWAIEKNVDIISMSLGGRYGSPLEEELIDAAVGKGIIVCAAAGNDGYGKSYPAAFEGVISVAAVDRHNEHAYFSNIDESVDVSAPGVDVLSCVPGGGYKEMSGTSMACPIAAGVVALMRAVRNGAGESALKEACQRLGAAEEYGAGLVRADKCVGAARADGAANQYKGTQMVR